MQCACCQGEKLTDGDRALPLALAFAPPPPRPDGLQPHPESANDIAVRPDGSEAVVALEGRLLRYSTRSLSFTISTALWMSYASGVIDTIGMIEPHASRTNPSV